MVHAIPHDPFRLFGFALRESDWVLADLLAGRLEGSDPARRRLEHELGANTSARGGPESLPELRRIAMLTRRLALEDEDV